MVARTKLFVVETYDYENGGHLTRFDLFHHMRDALKHTRLLCDQRIADYRIHNREADAPEVTCEERFLSPMEREFIIRIGSMIVDSFNVRRTLVY